MVEAPGWIEWLAFGVSVAGAAAIFTLSALSAFRQEFQFFPPPDKHSWQHKTFLGLFRLYLYPLVALSALVVQPPSDSLGYARCAAGTLLVIIGFGLAFRITLQMGWRNAFGEKRGLMTTGWFSWSRNPIYVVTWIGLIGWGLIVPDVRTVALLVLWAGMYWIAPRFEEPWLEQEYGETYRAYKMRTPRFI